MKSELANLIELQKTDTRLRQLKENLESADKRRAELEQEFDRHASSIRDIQTRHRVAKETKSENETSIIESKSGLERANRNLKTAQDQKQYEAAMREIDALNKQISKHETGVLEQMETIDEVEAILEERSEEIENLESDWQKTLEEFETSLSDDNEEFERLSAERAKVFGELSPRLASVYNRLVTRSRDGIAVAEVVHGSCSACFMSLRKQVVVELKTTSNIITCESCTRILYVAEDVRSGATASQ